MSFDAGALAAAVAAHGAVARVVLARVAGSAPREAGAAMLVWDAGQSGTIGGGALELAATTEARAMLAAGRRRRARQMPLGPGLGQCCGGSVLLACEVFGPDDLPATLPFARPMEGDATPPVPPRVAARAEAMAPGAPPAVVEGWLIEAAPAPRRALWIHGAGHVGRALVGVLAPLPDFAITWVDTAPDRFPGEMPAGVAPLVAADPAAAVRHASRGAEHLVMTYSHDIDLALCHALLRHGFAWAGLIGSETKWARFRSRLAALGHEDAQISRIACPIGDPALGRHPQAIAVGVAAALLKSAAQDGLPEAAAGTGTVRDGAEAAGGTAGRGTGGGDAGSNTGGGTAGSRTGGGNAAQRAVGMRAGDRTGGAFAGTGERAG